MKRPQRPFKVPQMSNVLHASGGYNYGADLGGWGKFQLDISFPLEIIAMFFFTLMVLLGTIHKRLRVSQALCSASTGHRFRSGTDCPWHS